MIQNWFFQKEVKHDRRKYYRIRTIFPVILSVKNSEGFCKKIQGFSKDISSEGLCMEFYELDKDFSIWLREQYYFSIEIEVPFQKESIFSEITIVWRVTDDASNTRKHVMGVQFKNLHSDVKKRLVRYAKRNRRQPFLLLGSFLLLLVMFFVFHKSYLEIQDALSKNENLVRVSKEKMNLVQEQRVHLEKSLTSLNRKFFLMQKQLKDYELEQAKLEQKLRKEEDLHLAKIQKELEDVRKSEENAKKMAGDYLAEKWQLEETLKKILTEKRSLLEELSGLKVEQEKMQNALNEFEKIKKKEALYNITLKSGVTLVGKLLREQEHSIDLLVGKKVLNLHKEKIERIWDGTVGENRIKNENENRCVESEIPEISIQNKRIFVNNQLFYIKGVAYAIDFPKYAGGMKDYYKISKDVFEKDFLMMKKAGINVIRTYEPLNFELLDLAWKHNIMVIENICYPDAKVDYSSSIQLKMMIDNAVETVLRHKNHPAILMWSLWNDAPWVWDVLGNPVERFSVATVERFLRKVAIEVRSCDSTHPLTASNVLGFQGSELGFSFLDVLGFNAYLGGIGCFVEQDAKSTLQKLIEISQRYQKPVVILETGFSTCSTTLDQGEIITKQIKMIGENLAGITVFQWTDGWNKAGFKDRQDFDIEEHWGICSGYREFKSGYEAVSRMYQAIPVNSKGFKE